ncbi:MAG: hypothetical protein ACOX6S_08440 [Clostridia bacterium]|jgi:hypothetical protein
MRKHRSQNRMKHISIFIVAMVFVSALLISSCSAAKRPGESQEPIIDPTEVTTSQLADDQGKEETATAVLNGEDESASTDVENEVKEIDASTNLQLGALKADMPKAEVEKAMKSELVDSTIKEEYGMETVILTYKDGTVINLLDGKVYSVSVKSPNYATPRGLKTGDTEETLRKLYGEPSAVEDGKWIYSSRGYDMFFVTVENGIVVEIMISQVL